MTILACHIVFNNDIENPLAPWRVLGIDKCGSLRSPQPSTRHGKDNENNTENQANRAPEKDLQSKDFLGRGDVTEQNGRVAKASRLQSEVYGDEKARRRGAVPADPLGDRLPLLQPHNAFFHWFYSRSMYLLNFAFSGRLW